MKRLVVLVLFLTACLPPGALYAEQKDAAIRVNRNGVCDGFDGLAFAFCVAMCEARECDQRSPYDKRCATLRHGFERVTGGQSAPCEAGGSVAASLEHL